MDNTTAISYINKQGGIKPQLQRLAAQLTAHCIIHNIDLHLHYIPSAQNTADAISRYMDPEDYKLNPAHFADFLYTLAQHHPRGPQTHKS